MRYEQIKDQTMLVVSKAEIGALVSFTSNEMWRANLTCIYVTDKAVAASQGAILIQWSSGSTYQPLSNDAVLVSREALVRAKGALSTREEVAIPLKDCTEIYLLTAPPSGATVGFITGTVTNSVAPNTDFPFEGLNRLVESNKLPAKHSEWGTTNFGYLTLDQRLVTKAAAAFTAFGFSGMRLAPGNDNHQPMSMSNSDPEKGTLSIYVAPLRP